MKKFLSIFILMVIVGWIASIFYKAYQPKPLVIQGEIDAQSYNISSKVPGRIAEIFVKKGDMVASGALIFTINSPEVRAKMAQAKAAAAATEAKSSEAQHGARKEQIQAAKDQWHKAGAAADLMQKTYNRVNNLYKDGVVAEQKRDEVYTKWQAAKYTENAAHQLYKMASLGARSEIKKAASEQAKVYASKVAEVQSYVEETNQYTYHSGEVTSILIHEGELSPTGFPVVSIVDINDSWAKFHVREDFLKHFEQGKKFQIKIPALSDEKRFEFEVSHIAVMGDYASWRASEAGSAYDMKSFEVELRPTQSIKNLRVGMSTLISF